ncbi:uncharacterized protein N7483_002798 [Penicillium malachiteum]|uniref:uncharacterized protein n=1 Tax=Penicillium malachiteum TaxID=1324776 RepID=UPI002546BE59|nr:uncharacterized protein N7483_002798 [Penicillium malachiteum]KAJ5737673.1 hypothetical protein N7483_002798 [Penicillium malachiteum]
MASDTTHTLLDQDSRYHVGGDLTDNKICGEPNEGPMSDGPMSQLAQGAEAESSGAIKESRLVHIANALARNA